MAEVVEGAVEEEVAPATRVWRVTMPGQNGPHTVAVTAGEAMVEERTLLFLDSDGGVTAAFNDWLYFLPDASD